MTDPKKTATKKPLYIFQEILEEHFNEASFRKEFNKKCKTGYTKAIYGIEVMPDGCYSVSFKIVG